MIKKHYTESVIQIKKYYLNKLASENEPSSTEEIIRSIFAISKALSPNQKIIISHKPIEGFVGKKIPQTTGPKPHGLWYSCGNDWIDWNISEGYLPLDNHDFFGGKFIYEIELDMNEIRQIKSKGELERFSAHRGAEQRGGRRGPQNYSSIYWDLVAQDYSGIEICPYISECRYSVPWYYAWDVASGCIWDSNAFKSIKLLASRTEGGDNWKINKSVWDVPRHFDEDEATSVSHNDKLALA